MQVFSLDWVSIVGNGPVHAGTRHNWRTKQEYHRGHAESEFAADHREFDIDQEPLFWNPLLTDLTLGKAQEAPWYHQISKCDRHIVSAASL